MLKISYSNQFKKDYKTALIRGYDMNELKKVISVLQKQEKLPAKYKDHKLQNTNKYKDVRECHIQPDWLLVYRIESNQLILELITMGTHSDLF